VLGANAEVSHWEALPLVVWGQGKSSTYTNMMCHGGKYCSSGTEHYGQGKIIAIVRGGLREKELSFELSL